MALNKVLCNILPGESIFLDHEFNTTEIETGNEMLDAAAKYWEALRSESGEALRVGFFVRKGIMRFTDPHWEMQVERSSIDVLIERLPWGISTIKLPWNSYILNLNW